MSLTLKQSHSIRQAAGLLYGFLPGSGHPAWRGWVTFQTIARDLGLGAFWVGGSKEPAIATLLEKTFDQRPERFQPLILTIVRNSLTYRQGQGKPIERKEIESLNRLLVEVGFKFPELWDSGFLDSLSRGVSSEPAGAALSKPATDSKDKFSNRQIALQRLAARFYALETEQDRQAAGYALEKLLNELFRLFNLDPRSAFRVTGEQIDGSIILDYETYLVEVKWHRHQTSESDLLAFRGKIEGKSAFTRGAFISIHGFTNEACEALVKGKQPNFFLIDGYDLTTVLESQIELTTLLRSKVRKLTEEGAVFVRVL